MRAAIIAMQPQPVATDDPLQDRENAANLAESLQALAIATALPRLNYTPWLVCEPDSHLAALPVPVPRFCIKPHGLLAFFKLWQWQRKENTMLILPVGQPSLKLARNLCRMGKKGSRQLVCAFPLLPPLRDKLIEQAVLCISGSTLITNAIHELTLQAKSQPKVEEAAPGIDISQYKYPAPQWQKGERFVFGMAASLLPLSGALLIIRAMSALWQNQDLPPWEVRMFGGGPRYYEIMEEAEKLGVLSRLSILDDQPLPEVTRHCHVWLAPGIAPDELPSVLWAGIAADIPIICAKSWLHEERLWNNNAAMITSPENPQEMASAMLALMRDATLRKKLCKAGATMRESISLAGMAERICVILEKNNFVVKETEKDKKDGESKKV